jgi:hypothetical protein
VGPVGSGDPALVAAVLVLVVAVIAIVKWRATVRLLVVVLIVLLLYGVFTVARDLQALNDAPTDQASRAQLEGHDVTDRR